MKKLSLSLVTIIIGFMGFSAWACGDNLYRVGKGVSYRVYTAPLPGNVLVHGHSDGAGMLAEALGESGHKVTLANSELDLSLEMKQQQFDVVIAAYSDHNALKFRT